LGSCATSTTSALAKAEKGSVEFFRNEDELTLWQDEDWDAAFFSGPYIEAGEWIKIVLASRIYTVKQQLLKERGTVAIDVRPHDDEFLYNPKSVNVAEIKEMRKERGYKVSVSVIEEFLGLLTDNVDPKWIEAAKKLK
jgi:hypothetical protein